MPRYRTASFLLFAALILLVGCGKKGPEMAEVEGTVTLKGKPLEKIYVEFLPEGNGPRSIGETDQNGRYTLTADDMKRKGAAVGTHKIILRDLSIINPNIRGRKAEGVDTSEGRKPRISTSLGDLRSTTLQKSVSKGKNTIDLDAGAAGPVEGGR